jgi:hypothetical protein
MGMEVDRLSIEGGRREWQLREAAISDQEAKKKKDCNTEVTEGRTQSAQR